MIRGYPTLLEHFFAKLDTERMSSWAAAIWEIKGRLYRQPKSNGFLARINFRDAAVLHRFRAEIGEGKVHTRDDGRFWLASDSFSVFLVARALWPSLSPIRQREFAALLPLLPNVEFLGADLAWVAGLFTFASLTSRRHMLSLRMPARGTIPMMVATRLKACVGGEIVPAEGAVDATCLGEAYWQLTNVDEIGALIERVRPFLVPTTQARFDEAVHQRPSPRPPASSAKRACQRCGEIVERILRLGRHRDLEHCACGLRLLDGERLIVRRSWEAEPPQPRPQDESRSVIPVLVERFVRSPFSDWTPADPAAFRPMPKSFE